MVLRQFLSDQEVLDEGESAIGDVLVQRHATTTSPLAENAATEDNVVYIVGDQVRHRRNELWCVLIVGVKHDHDVGTEIECCAVAGLLIAAIASIAIVTNHVLNPELTSNGRCVVARMIVDENNIVDNVEGDLEIGHFKGLRSVVRWKHHDDGFAVDHSISKITFTEADKSSVPPLTGVLCIASAFRLRAPRTMKLFP